MVWKFLKVIERNSPTCWIIYQNCILGLLCIERSHYLAALALQNVERETTNEIYCTLGKLISSVLIPAFCVANGRVIFHRL